VIGLRGSACHCGACGVRLQPLDPSSAWMDLATQLLADSGLKAGTLGMSLVVHTAIVHPELTELPPLVDDEGR